MINQLGRIKGGFLISINDAPEIRETFAAFQMTEITTTYMIAMQNDSREQRAELLVANFIMDL